MGSASLLKMFWLISLLFCRMLFKAPLDGKWGGHEVLSFWFNIDDRSNGRCCYEWEIADQLGRRWGGGGGLAVASAVDGVEFEAKITPIVIISCIMAATGGLMFGYDVGVSSGVTSMPDFLKKFFLVVYKRTIDGNLGSNYCKYDNQGLQLFTSLLYLAGLTAAFFASYTTLRLGRKLTMLIAGVFSSSELFVIID
ncbi:putative major facilitator, sugar transporter, major facilitator superfamily [Helianthus annuus]|nr:putative major facilitator, sugar transporter, major facilitator superfamily [Helianthus annuus]